jgi:hypothetical protein
MQFVLLCTITLSPYGWIGKDNVVIQILSIGPTGMTLVKQEASMQ